MLPPSLLSLDEAARRTRGGGCDAAPGIALKTQCARRIREGAGPQPPRLSVFAHGSVDYLRQKRHKNDRINARKRGSKYSGGC